MADGVPLHHYIESRYYIVCDRCSVKSEVTGNTKLNGLRLSKLGWTATRDDEAHCPRCSGKATR